MNNIRRSYYTPTILSRFKGCMIGAAIGDAMGMPMEGKTRTQINNEYNGKIDKFYPKAKKLQAGQWTDDTLLSLATVDSIIKEKAIVPSKIAKSMLDAYCKESGRGFGRATITALTRIKKGNHWNNSGDSHSLGSGAAMRIAPIALFSHLRHDQLERNCGLIAQITHRNIEAVNGSLAVAFILAQIINSTFEEKNIINGIIDFIGEGEMSKKLQEVGQLLNNPCKNFNDDIERLGLEGSVFEVVGSSIYAFISHLNSFEEAVVASVSAGGDTDTRASIVGAFSGCLLGIENMPKNWVDNVENSDAILAKAEALYILVHPGR